MLFIYGNLGLGGIETFFVRIAKERYLKGLVTKILLLQPEMRSDKELLEQMKEYATVYSSKDISYYQFLTQQFKLISPIKKDSLPNLFDGVSQIHVFGGDDALLGYRLSNLLKIPIPITVGFYHHARYLWGGGNVPYYEKINRKFVLQYLPKELLLTFSKDNIKLYKEYAGIDLTTAQTFSLGVIDKKYPFIPLLRNSKLIKICSVGRLVNFKTYNIQMIEVVEELSQHNVNVQYDIYGDGPLMKKMDHLIMSKKLESHVFLKGSLNYSKFDEVVSTYDLFVGGGTAIIQATALGVPSITAIDDMRESLNYGYFYEVYDRQYTRQGLDIKLYSFYELINDYNNMNLVDKNRLKKRHINCIDQFINKNCAENLDELKSINMPKQIFKYNAILYEITHVLNMIRFKVDKKYFNNIRSKLPSTILYDLQDNKKN